jgi:hypothetical protein
MESTPTSGNPGGLLLPAARSEEFGVADMMVRGVDAVEADALKFRLDRNRKTNLHYATWMTELGDTLGGQSLNRIVIPGTHDTGTYSITPLSTLAPDGNLSGNCEKACRSCGQWTCDHIESLVINNLPTTWFVSRWSRTQTHDVADQLAAGMRYFDFRVISDGDTIKVAHALYGDAVDGMIDQIKTFVDTHPQEIVLLDFNHFYRMGDGHHQRLISKLQQAFGPKLIPPPAWGRQGQDGPETDALLIRNLWSKRQQVMVLYDDAHPDAVPEFWTAGINNGSSYWPNKPSFGAMKTSLDATMAGETLAQKNFWVLQMLLTANNDVYAKAGVKLALLGSVGTLRKEMEAAQKAVDTADKALGKLRGAFETLEKKLKKYRLDWLIPEPLKKAWEKARDEVSAGVNDLNKAKSKLTEATAALEKELAKIDNAPTSLEELTTPALPQMTDLLESGWADAKAKIVIMDFAGANDLVDYAIDVNGQRATPAVVQ